MESPDVELRHIVILKQYATAAWVLAVYEYIITFDREVQSIWKRKHSFATFLWVLNRYNLPLSFCPVILLGLFIPLTKEQCDKFVILPGVAHIVCNLSTGLTLSLRTYALYGRSNWILGVLLPLLAAEVAVDIWAVVGGIPVPLPPGVIGCILTGNPEQGDRFAFVWIGQLIFPTIIFLLTIGRAAALRRKGMIHGGILALMVRDGVMYFIVIFLINAVNVVTYVAAPRDVQTMNAAFSVLFTSMMMCRLMLNLRSVPESSTYGDTGYSLNLSVNSYLARDNRLIGNLGADLDIDNVENREVSVRDVSLGNTGERVRKEHDYELRVYYSDGSEPPAQGYAI